MKKILIGDLETNSLTPSIIHMIGIIDYQTNEWFDYHGDEVVDGLIRLQEADIIIGHHFKGYDHKVITKLTEGLIEIDKNKIVDTLDLSRKYCILPDHKLVTWGEMFETPKGNHKDFTKYTPEMAIYCKRDCEIVKLAFELLHEMHLEAGGQNLLE